MNHKPRPHAATRLNLSAGLASVTVAATLVGLKLWAFAETSALSVAASLVDSGLDLMVSLAGFAAIAYAARPADDDHAFGHTSAEDLAALAQALFLAVSAIVIGWGAAQRLLAPGPVPLASENYGIAVMSISILLTVALLVWQRHVARRTGSRVVAADALHYLSDLLPTLGAIAALWVSSRYGIGSIDSAVALIAAAILLLGALRIGKGAFDALMDRSADPGLVSGISAIVKGWPGVKGFHDLKTRTAGAKVFVNIHIELDGDQSLREAHAIGAALRRKIIETYPQTDVIVHKDVSGET
jgi:ferrous-iron efflux pump FieF